MSDERETRLFMISPNSMLTPDQLVRTVHAMNKGVKVKETCYGCLVEGPKAVVLDVLAQLRKKYRNEVFSKPRAYLTSDPRRCRAQHGTRPGYAQLESEWALLSNVQYGLECADRGEVLEPEETKEKLPVDVFRKICEE
ncbi:MAG: DUF2102 domain-containing protein [Candidatus Methanomethylophilaceae archaeon]|jgi:putative methanogenesis marker protein 6